MDIVFKNDKLRKEFNDHRALRRERGEQRAEKIMQRLAQLEAAECLKDVFSLPGKYHPLTGDRAGQVAAHLDANYRLLFEPADEPVPQLPEGGPDWSKVTTVRILGVCDYHGDKHSKPV